MGIRVDADTLKHQLALTGDEDRLMPLQLQAIFVTGQRQLMLQRCLLYTSRCV